MNTLYDVKAKVRQLVSDPDGGWLDDATLVPLINQIYEQQTAYLFGSGSPYITKLVVIPNVAAGVTSLIPQQQGPLKELYGLIQPRKIDAKIAGTPDNNYCPLEERDVLPDLPPGFPINRGCWEWRAFRIWLVAFAQAMDLRIRGEFTIPALTQDTDVLLLHPLMAHSTAYGTAALAAASVGNPGWQQTYSQQAETTLENINAQLVRERQKVTYRVGRIGRNGRGGNRGYSNSN